MQTEKEREGGDFHVLARSSNVLKRSFRFSMVVGQLRLLAPADTPSDGGPWLWSLSLEPSSKDSHCSLSLILAVVCWFAVISNPLAYDPRKILFTC